MKRSYLNRWNNDYISPGIVGSVGDANLEVRLKQSTPDMPMRWSPMTAGQNEEKYGSNIQNGNSVSYTSRGKGPKTFVSGQVNGRGFRKSYGWVYQDVRAPDKLHEPTLCSTPQYSWNNKIATAVKDNGTPYSRLPGGYQPRGVPRGGNFPRTTALEEGDTLQSLSVLNPMARFPTSK